MAGAWHGMCELTSHSMAGEQHGNGWERHGICELALIVAEGKRTTIF
jgi:hypothetical protein